MHEVDVTDHAVRRYGERVRPGLGFKQCERELLHVLTLAVVSEAVPEWAAGQAHEDIVMWALLGDDIAFPLQRAPQGHLVAATCLTRLGCSEFSRARRQERKARRRAARHQNVDSRRGTSRRWDGPVAA